MGIISWLVVGAIAGILAGFFVTGDEGLGIIGRILLGIVGAVIGGFVAGARQEPSIRRQERKRRQREHGPDILPGIQFREERAWRASC